MTKKEHEALVEQAVKDYARSMKEDRDMDTVIAYGEKLRRTGKMYSRKAEAYSTGGQKSRAYAIGACVLELVAQIEKDAKEKKFVPGTMEWTINEDRVKDEDGKKGYRYTVAFHVASEEKVYTEEQIREQVEDLRQRLAKETAEIFGEETGGDPSTAPDGSAQDDNGGMMAEVKDTSIQ